MEVFYIVSCQINVFLNRLNGEPIGVSVLGIFVIDKKTILAVRSASSILYSDVAIKSFTLL